MAITRYPPRTIHLGGQITEVNDLAGKNAITPGFLIERFNDAGTPKFRAHSTAGGRGTRTVALNAPHLNKGVDDAYADGDLMHAAVAVPGATFWMLIAAGQNLVAGDFLESAGNGLIQKLTTGVALFQALVNTDNTAGPGTMRIKVEAL
jgi:hypothetical protein